jgi:hypothetical protein
MCIGIPIGITLDHTSDEDLGITEPVVYECDNPAQPCTGQQLDNAEHPPVYEGVFTALWTELNDMGSQRYINCVKATLGIDWGDTVPRLEELEANGDVTAFILAVNTTISDAKARELVDVPEGVSTENLQVVRTDQITSTHGSCKESVDTDSRVDYSLGLLDEDKQLIPDKGVFGGSHNPWRIDKPQG